MATIEEIDSGMESLRGDSKSVSPELPPGAKWAHEADDLDDEDLDETLTERLVGLSEMFPESVRTGSVKLASWSAQAVKSLYGFSRNAVWVVFSSSIILFAPVVFEIERAKVIESQRQHQRQVCMIWFYLDPVPQWEDLLHQERACRWGWVFHHRFDEIVLYVPKLS
ncbi:unnamed protein product [Notodromas monacha]|uniref:Mitochondrial import receptor subunit TOM22 homolog n=1 Tax=Notodromas monacha TaxID=399045 RepID=A0A7R9G9H3_9CRUS|nr:unnamed protein product [Notodromas monacha]CAG0914212.1 unnamed protein product [Notodromas monacha]